MLSRRLVRIKALQAVYAYRQLDDKNKDALLNLYHSNIDNLQKAYNHSLWFIKALDYFLLSEIDIETSKYFPAKERIRQFQLLANNSLIPIFDRSELLEKEVKKLNISWDDEGEAINSFLKELVTKDFVIDYLVFDKPNFKVSQKFIIQLLEYALGKSGFIKDAMENAIITWHDDYRVVLRALIETISSLKSEVSLLDIYNFNSDAATEIAYGEKLCTSAIKNEQDIMALAQKHTKNWDVDRIAQTDQIIMLLATCEFQYFKDIPIKVTINEYLEIAKQYSTPQSSNFLNGVLDSLKNELVKEGKIEKNAKGLRDK